MHNVLAVVERRSFATGRGLLSTLCLHQSTTSLRSALQEVSVDRICELPVHFHLDGPSLNCRAAGLPQEQC